MRGLQPLRFIDAIARAGSIRGAAEGLAITSTALNRRLLALEEELGVPVFERLPRGVRLSTAGELLIHHLRTQAADYEKLKGQIADLRASGAAMFPSPARRPSCPISCPSASAPTGATISEVEVVDVVGIERRQRRLGVDRVVLVDRDRAEVRHLEGGADLVLDRPLVRPVDEVGGEPALVVGRPELERVTVPSLTKSRISEGRPRPVTCTWSAMPRDCTTCAAAAMPTVVGAITPRRFGIVGEQRLHLGRRLLGLVVAVDRRHQFMLAYFGSLASVSFMPTIHLFWSGASVVADRIAISPRSR
jgi:DNA-binding transcriptional LysR family regulator